MQHLHAAYPQVKVYVKSPHSLEGRVLTKFKHPEGEGLEKHCGKKRKATVVFNKEATCSKKGDTYRWRDRGLFCSNYH